MFASVNRVAHAMRLLVRDIIIWVIIAILSGCTASLFVSWVARSPPTGSVPISIACQEYDSLVSGVRVFVIVLLLGLGLCFFGEFGRHIIRSGPVLRSPSVECPKRKPNGESQEQESNGDAASFQRGGKGAER